MNEQERLWQGAFGNHYHLRNEFVDRRTFWELIIANIDFFGGSIAPIKSVLEVGAGKGENLVALRELIPECCFTGAEINSLAAEIMRGKGFSVLEGAANSVLPSGGAYDLVITRGFLIHVPSEDLCFTLKNLYAVSSRYICIAEYYSPVRREISYRGHAQALWTDDYTKRLMDLFPKLKLMAYAFCYHIDGGDDLTWFLLEK